MVKIIAFDIDGTLAKHNEGSTRETIEKLKELEKEGFKICLISGKPIDYVSGQARQLGLKDPIVSGENGAIIYLNNDYPITETIEFTYDENDNDKIIKYKEYIKSNYDKETWIQPNRVNFAFFVLDESAVNEIYQNTLEYFENTSFEVYLHPDNAIDIIYKGINKGWAINKLKGYFGYNKEDFITVGDGLNDVPMFIETYYSIGIKRTDTKHNVKNIEEAFEVIDKIINNKI